MYQVPVWGENETDLTTKCPLAVFFLSNAQLLLFLFMCLFCGVKDQTQGLIACKESSEPWNHKKVFP